MESLFKDGGKKVQWVDLFLLLYMAVDIKEGAIVIKIAPLLLLCLFKHSLARSE